MKIITGAYTNEKGELFHYDPMQFLEEISYHKNCEFQLTLEKIGDDLTDPQRGYWFGVVNRIIWLHLREQGYRLTESDAHKWNCSHSIELKETIRFINDSENEIVLKDVEVPFSKAKKPMISRFIDERIEFAREKLNLKIPPPPPPGSLFTRISRDLSELKKFRK